MILNILFGIAGGIAIASIFAAVCISHWAKTTNTNTRELFGDLIEEFGRLFRASLALLTIIATISIFIK